ncbi:MAG: hypothetical protein ACFE9S_12205 [Candidatus Hermodarchaeota archaeon]
MVKQRKASQKSINISKGIVFVFLIVYLIIFGIIITDFIIHIQEAYPSELPVWWGILSYVPLLCYFGALFCGIFLIVFLRNATTIKVRQTQSRKKIKSGSIYKQALFAVIFVFVFVPLFSPVIDQGINDHYTSVYNPYWNGASDFKNIIEAEGYEVMTVQSSLSATERLDRSILLILLGPNQYYDPIFEIPYFINFFNSSNSLLVCHDHGSTSTLLWEIMLAGAFSGQLMPLTIFPDGILLDNASYELTATPEFPIIRKFSDTHPTANGIDEVILSMSSCAVGGPFIDFFGWEAIGSSSETYSFIDKNNNKRYDSPEDDLNLGFMSLITSFAGSSSEGLPFSDFPLDDLALGGYPQHVFLAKDSGGQRTFVSADASLFNNDLIDEYDNREFGINIIEWLTYVNEGRSKDEWIVVFDEAHIRPEFSRDLSSAGIFGYVMQYIVHLSTNPITAWIYPLLAFYSLRKYLPKKDKKKEDEKKAEEEEKKEEIARFRTSSFFAQKIEDYKNKMKYGDALKLLYRRLERKLNSQLGGKKITTKNVIDLVIAKDPSTTKLKSRRLGKFMDKILAIKEGKDKIKTEQDFEDLFFEMDWAVNNI